MLLFTAGRCRAAGLAVRAHPSCWGEAALEGLPDEWFGEGYSHLMREVLPKPAAAPPFASRRHRLGDGLAVQQIESAPSATDPLSWQTCPKAVMAE